MSDILGITHDMAKDLHEIGAMDDITMRVMEELRMPKHETSQQKPSFPSLDPLDSQEGFGQ